MNSRDQMIRDSYVRFLGSRKFDPYFRKMVRYPKWRYILAIPLILSVGLAPIGIGLVLSARSSVNRLKAFRNALISTAKRSLPVVAYPVMANSSLMSQKGMTAPAMVIFTFDQDATTHEMAEVAMKMMTAEAEEISEASKAAVAKMFSEMDYTPGRRRPLPRDLTEGRLIYAADLMITSDFLPTETLEEPLIACVAEPGESGMIQMIPWWVAAEAMAKA